VFTAHTQLRLAAPLATDQRKPWEKTSRPGVGKTVTRPSTLYERGQVRS
jgi:hypothetical protein